MSMYIPVFCNSVALDEELRILIEATDKFDEVIIGGDMNARYRWWKVKPEDQNNANGKVLANFQEIFLKSPPIKT